MPFYGKKNGRDSWALRKMTVLGQTCDQLYLAIDRQYNVYNEVMNTQYFIDMEIPRICAIKNINLWVKPHFRIF